MKNLLGIAHKLMVNERNWIFYLYDYEGWRKNHFPSVEEILFYSTEKTLNLISNKLISRTISNAQGAVLEKLKVKLLAYLAQEPENHVADEVEDA